MREGSRVFVSRELTRRVRTPPRTKGQPKGRYERYERNDEASPGAADIEEDGNVHRQTKLQPWPHQGGGGGEEAHRRRARGQVHRRARKNGEGARACRPR